MTAERTFSISAGLDASTVTPGSTAPEVSRTDAGDRSLGGRENRDEPGDEGNQRKTALETHEISPS